MKPSSAPELPQAVAKQYGLERQLSRWQKVVAIMTWWWRHPSVRWPLIVLGIVGSITVVAVPQSRYALLNSAGVRSSAKVTIIDDATQLPLGKVTVTIAGQSAVTDRNGLAIFRRVRLGATTLRVERIAFASYKRELTVGWGSNPLGSVALRATGLRYDLHIADYVTGEPITNAEVDTDRATALSDAKGKVVLTVAEPDTTQLEVVVAADGYHSRTVALDARNPAGFEITLVPDGKHVYVSKQSGRYDVYSSDLDGQNSKVLLAGTGTEGSDISLVVKCDGSQAALVSTRDDQRDSDGYLLRTLTLIDVASGRSTTVDHAEQIQLIDWLDTSLVYNSIIAGASAANPQRNKLIAYDFAKNSRVQLATANQFNTIISAGHALYYAMSSTDPEAKLGLFRINPDGTKRQEITTTEVWTGLRSTYTTLSLQTPDGWYAYDISTTKLEKVNTAPSVISYIFTNNDDNSRSVWTDIRDGTGTLLLLDITKTTNLRLREQDGLTDPVRWIGSDYIIYRVANKTETADYIVGRNGGPARKIHDVSVTYGYVKAY